MTLMVTGFIPFIGFSRHFTQIQGVLPQFKDNFSDFPRQPWIQGLLKVETKFKDFSRWVGTMLDQFPIRILTKSDICSKAGWYIFYQIILGWVQPKTDQVEVITDILFLVDWICFDLIFSKCLEPIDILDTLRSNWHTRHENSINIQQQFKLFLVSCLVAWQRFTHSF